MDKCTNKNIGQLITFYEMGVLNEKDRIQFEDHVLECNYCRHELQRLNPKLEVLFKNKLEILQNLNAKGITFETERDQLLNQAVAKETLPESIWERIYNFISRGWFPKAAIPALAVATAIVLILFLPRSPAPDNPYHKYLSFEKAPFLSLGDTRVMETEAQRFFNEGMRFYQRDDFVSAISNLEKTVGVDSTVGKFWLYLGISYYLNQQPEPAIDALAKAKQKLDTVERNRALWYLAQAYLLYGYAENSIPILHTLSRQRMEYAQEANNLLSKIREISPGLFKN